MFASWISFVNYCSNNQISNYFDFNVTKCDIAVQSSKSTIFVLPAAYAILYLMLLVLKRELIVFITYKAKFIAKIYAENLVEIVLEALEIMLIVCKILYP